MAENKQTAAARRERRKRRHPWAFPLGLLVFILTVVGAATVIYGCVTGIRSLTDNVEKKMEYQQFLTPIVMFNPDAFDDLTQANSQQLIDCSIWAVINSNLEPDQYVTDEGVMLIPQADVEKQFQRLFGTEIKAAHQTVSGYGYEFVYDEAAKTYSIPLTGVEPIYTPRVESISKKGNTITVIVGCIASNQWAQNEQGEMVAVQADKYMKATLRENENGYYLSALQATDAPETARASKTESAPQETGSAPQTTQAAAAGSGSTAPAA